MIRQPLTIIGCIALLSGCAVGPNYKQPTVASPGNFRSAPSKATTNSLADLPWWDIYRDETLRSLIHIALTNNYDVLIAATRVEQAREVSAQARAQFFPSINYQGAVSKGRNEIFGTPIPNNGRTGDSALALADAAWEVDF